MRSSSPAEGTSILPEKSTSWKKALAPPRALKAAFSMALSFTSSKSTEGDRYARGLLEWNARSLEPPADFHRTGSYDSSIAPSDASTHSTPSRTATDMSLRKRRPSINPLDRLPTGGTEVQDDAGTRSEMLASFAAVECWGLCEKHDRSPYGAGFQKVHVKLTGSSSV